MRQGSSQGRPLSFVAQRLPLRRMILSPHAVQQRMGAAALLHLGGEVTPDSVVAQPISEALAQASGVRDRAPMLPRPLVKLRGPFFRLAMAISAGATSTIVEAAWRG